MSKTRQAITQDRRDVKFFPGQTVKLRSGGPAMTVTSPDADQPSPVESRTLRCAWFDSNNVAHSEVFPIYSLVDVDRDFPTPRDSSSSPYARD